MKLLCKLGIHKWGPPPVNCEFVYEIIDGRKYPDVQRCKRCGKWKRRDLHDR